MARVLFSTRMTANKTVKIKKKQGAISSRSSSHELIICLYPEIQSHFP